MAAAFVISAPDVKRGGTTDAPSAYHVGLAVKGGAARFRGINGFLPAGTRVPSIYSTFSPPLP